MFVIYNPMKERLILKEREKQSLNFTPVCDFFTGVERLYFPGGRTVHVDFSQGKVLDTSSRY